MLDACQRTARCISTCRSLHVNVLSMRCISTHLWLQVSFWCARREPPCSGREFCTKVSPQHAQNQVPIHHDVSFTRSLSRSLTSCLTSLSCCLTSLSCCLTYSLAVSLTNSLYHLPTRCAVSLTHSMCCITYPLAVSCMYYTRGGAMTVAVFLVASFTHSRLTHSFQARDTCCWRISCKRSSNR